MAQHAPRFLQLVAEAKQHIRECTVDDVKAKLDRRETFHLVDVREESEWAKDHLPRAVHLGKGVIERDVEQKIPDTSAEIVPTTVAKVNSPVRMTRTATTWPPNVRGGPGIGSVAMTE